MVAISHPMGRGSAAEHRLDSSAIPPTADALEQLLRAHPVFAGCSRPMLNKLARASLHVSRPASACLFLEGDPARHAFLVASGEVLLVCSVQGRTEQVRRIVGPGELFGELDLLAGSRRTSTARATMPTTAWAIAGDAFLDCLQAAPMAGLALLRQVAHRFTAREAEFRDLLSLDLKGRLARALLILAERHGQAEPNGGIRIGTRLTHKELGGIIGASRENVSRALAGFRARRLIEYSTDTVRVLDPEQLRRLT